MGLKVVEKVIQVWFIKFLKNHRVGEMRIAFKSRLAEELGFRRLERMKTRHLDSWIMGLEAH